MEEWWMELNNWPDRQLNWEPIGKNGLCVALHDDFVWFSNKSSVPHAMTLETAAELRDWLDDVVTTTVRPERWR